MKILFVDNHPEFTHTVIECFLREHDVTVVPTIAGANAVCAKTSFGRIQTVLRELVVTALAID